ncbi:MAG TPA: hypothetical protein VK348_00565, partial [Planctomycetota bacterium]|nr:hypothetical protein [Planctomycetota bacterium]
QRDAFTLAHRDWIDPGVSESPTRKYRIETVCGFETLLGAARTVELHHARLVAHCGADPFADRQGTVRIVPEHSDLESDGAPFWWVGGFQSGDRTTIRFAWGDLPGMGRLLTHELTHRFDGVLHAFLPAWYMEGHASWTAAHYGKAAEADCTEDLLDSGTCAHTFYKGYGDFGNFKKLVAGEVAEYRDNYFAGYSLYAFLRGWPPKEPPRYREALRHFEQNGRAGSKEPLRFFSSCFCDGKPGHAATLEEFHAQWAAFLRGCYEYQDERSHNDSNAWVGKYGRRGDGDHGGLLFDEPTWSWARARAEPWFGQGQAGLAAELLRAAGDVDAAAAAALWSLQVDGWRQQNAMALVELLTQRNQQVAAFAAAALLRQRFPTALPGPGAPAPMLAQLPRTRSYVDALAAAAADRDSVAAAALRSEHDLLAARLGLPAARAPAAAAAATPPDVPRLLSGLGYAEDGLTGFEDRRQQGLWFSTPDGDLHVGREKPRDATGLRDRAAHQRDAFVRTVDWMAAGAYVLKARIHFTTAFVSGAVLIGHWRRDRDVRLHFSAGDYDYATGRNDKDIGFRSVNLSLEAMWERDNQHMPDSTPARQFDFDGEASWLDLELRVQGPSLLVLTGGHALFRYTTPDGSPIEGHVGFAMGQGAIRVQQPTAQRLDVGTAAAGNRDVGLDTGAALALPLEDQLLLPTRGIPVAPCGTLLLWVPGKSDADDDVRVTRVAAALPVLARLLHDTTDHPQQWLLAVPAGMQDALIAGLQDRLRELRPDGLPVVVHQPDQLQGHDPWLLFVDAAGVLRAVAEVGDARLYSKVQKWARMFRAR